MSEFCTNAKNIIVFVGWILTIFKIAIPLLIIGFGMFDLGKAVVGSKDDEIKKSAKSLLWRAIAGVCVFFVPTAVMWVFKVAVTDFDDLQTNTDFDVCYSAILTPWR